MDKIKILKVEPGKPPCVKEIANDFKASQAEVEGDMRHLEHIIEENVSGRKSGGHRQGIDRKLARKIRQKKIAQGHAVDDHEDMVQTQ